MNHPNPNRLRGTWGGVVAAFITAAMFVAIAGQWFGCSPERDYKVLSFFFDGVPDPNAPPAAAAGDEFAATGQPVARAIMHKPFADNQCDACHATSSGRFEDFDKADDSSCAKCHPNVQTQYPVMHGPVAIGGCSFCHVPHESTVPALLIDTAPAVCLTCHDRELLPAEPPDHATDRSCLDCHVGHGSNSHGLLRPDWKPRASALIPPSVATVESGDAARAGNGAAGPPATPSRPSDAAVAAVAAIVASTMVGPASPPAAAQEGPIVVGQRERPPVVSLYGWRGQLESLWRYRADSRKLTDGDEDEFSENRFEETLTVETQGHIYHPNLVELNLAGTVGLTQSQIEDEDDSRTEFGFINEYDLNAIILRKEKAPVTLYARRTQNQINREFGPTLDNTLSSFGAIWDIRSERTPTRLEVYRSQQTQSGIAGDDGIGDFELTQNVFTWHSEARPYQGHALSWDYTLSQVTESTTGFSDNDYILNDANLSYSIDFGKDDRSNFLSSLSFFDQTGDFPISRLRWLEQLRLYHDPSFETRYQFTYDYQSFSDVDGESLDQDRFRGLAGFIHRLYKSLETSGNIGAERITRSDDSASTEYFADLRFDYVKQVPLGRLSLFLNLAYNWQENEQRVTPTPVIDVPRQFNDPAPIVLVGTAIDPSSIRITDPSGIVLYRPGADYTVTPFGDRVEIDRVLGGRIPSGQTVLIDYLLVPQAENVTTTTLYSFGGRYDIDLPGDGILSPYARFARQDQNIGSDDPSAFTANTFTDVIVGVEYRWRDLTLGIEQEFRDANISPFDSTRYWARYTHFFSRDLLVNLNATYIQIDYTDEDNHVDLLALSGSVQWRVTREFTVTGSVVWRDEDDEQSGPTRGLEEQIEFRWQKRQTLVYGLLRNSNLETDFQENHFLVAEIGIRRDF